MPQLLRLFVCDKNKVISQHFRSLVHIVLLRFLWRHLIQPHNERVLNAKDRIASLVVRTANVQGAIM
jgi:hypothetical protein